MIKSHSERILAEVKREKQRRYRVRPEGVRYWHDVLNGALFKNQLVLKDFVIINMDDSVALFDYVDETGIDFFSFLPKYRSRWDFVEILAHEMVHQYQFQVENHFDNEHDETFWRWKSRFRRNGLKLKLCYWGGSN